MKKLLKVLLILFALFIIACGGLYGVAYYYGYVPSPKEACRIIASYLPQRSPEGPDAKTRKKIREFVRKYEEIADNIGPNEENYNPNVYALEASRGELREEYFGIKLADLKTDGKGYYTMTNEQRQTFIKNLLGSYKCSLQWIGWEKSGVCTFALENGELTCKGGQRDGGNYLEIDGRIEVVNPIHLRFTGTIKTQVDYIANGREVVRKGTYNFKVRGKRGYWRMQEITNPVDGCADYVDIYFDSRVK